MTKRVLLFVVLIALVGIIGWTGRVGAQQGPAGQLLKAYPVQGNIYVIPEPGGANVLVSLGQSGVMLVDSGNAQLGDRLLASVKQLALDVLSRPTPFQPCVGQNCAAYRYPWGRTGNSFDGVTASPAPPHPIRYILNTSTDADHTGGNAKIGPAGVTYVGGNITGTIADPGSGAAIVSHENVLHEMTDQKAPDPALPTETYNGPSYKLSWFFNGEGVQFFHPVSAHSDADSIVYFRYSDVLATGEIYNTLSYPIIDAAHGGSVNGVVDALSQILDIAYPEFRSEGGTVIIPGRGRISDVADVANYRNMVYIIRDRIKDAKQKGRTLEQVKAAKLTLDYDGRYSKAPQTADQFVTAVYNTVK